MKIVSAAEMREIDRVTSDRFGVPSLTLMENAGRRLPALSSPIVRGRSASVLCAAKGITAAMGLLWRASWLKQGARCAFFCCAMRQSFVRCGHHVSEHDEGAACSERCACGRARG